MIKAYRIKLISIQGQPTYENPSGMQIIAPRGFAEGQIILADDDQRAKAGRWLEEKCVRCPWLDEPEVKS